MTQAYGTGLGVIAVPTEPSAASAAEGGPYSAADRCRWSAAEGGSLPARNRIYYYGVSFKQPDRRLAAPERWDQLDSKSALENLMDQHTGGAWREGAGGSGARAPAAFGGLVDVLLRSTPPDRLELLGLHSRLPLAEWHRGRCVLVGDAVHAPLPTSGQGVNMAVEDAYALAEELGRRLLVPAGQAKAASADEVRAAFAAFRSRRYAKTKAMVSMGRRIINMETGVTSPLVARVRDAALGLAYSKGWLLAALEKQVISDLVVPLDALR